MDIPLLDVYLACSIVTTFAFVYLLYSFILLRQKKSYLDHLSTIEIDTLNQNIAGLITDFSLDQNSDSEQEPI